MSLCLPGAISDVEKLDAYEDFAFLGRQFRLETGVVATPPLVDPYGGRRWLEEYQSPPRNKVVVKKFRSTYLDAVICALRAAVQTSMISIIGFGEGGLVAMGLLSPEVRAAAFSERRLLETESIPLELCAKSLTHVVVLAPHSYPHKSYMQLLRTRACWFCTSSWCPGCFRRPDP